MTGSTITGERDDTAQHSLWNGTTPKARWQESSWGKRIAAIAAVLVPIAMTVATAIARKKRTGAMERKLKEAGGRR